VQEYDGSVLTGLKYCLVVSLKEDLV